jgi:transposase
MLSPADLDNLDPEQLRTLMAQVSDKDRELVYRQTRIDQLAHEISLPKRYDCGQQRGMPSYVGNRESHEERPERSLGE